VRFKHMIKRIMQYTERNKGKEIISIQVANEQITMKCLVCYTNESERGGDYLTNGLPNWIAKTIIDKFIKQHSHEELK
jgi:ribosomal silencing factor RsfS